MPEPAEFLEAYGFTEGSKFGPMTLISASATHTQVKRWKEYSYHITLTLQMSSRSQGDEAYHEAFDAVARVSKQEYSVKATRNYYSCEIDPPQYGNVEIDDSRGTMTMHLTGHASR
jgi:hypothetical protein